MQLHFLRGYDFSDTSEVKIEILSLFLWLNLNNKYYETSCTTSRISWTGMFTDLLWRTFFHYRRFLPPTCGTGLQSKKERLPQGDLFAIFDTDLTPYEREALEFLYAYMPLADITDYPGEFHLMNVRASQKAADEMPWGEVIPEDLFRHFVLPVRVNNEQLDSARVIFYDELKNRVKSLSLYDAILEVNHWCHEKAVYTPSDARTSSPLATVRTAYGRCGEESTLLVAALRSVGIPARQVYTPRWAHTDDIMRG